METRPERGRNGLQRGGHGLMQMKHNEVDQVPILGVIPYHLGRVEIRCIGRKPLYLADVAKRYSPNRRLRGAIAIAAIADRRS